MMPFKTCRDYQDFKGAHAMNLNEQAAWSGTSATLATLYEAMNTADEAYQAALEDAYKQQAGDMRYQPAKQKPAIRTLGDQYKAAMEAWRVEYRRVCGEGR